MVFFVSESGKISKISTSLFRKTACCIGVTDARLRVRTLFFFFFEYAKKANERMKE